MFFRGEIIVCRCGCDIVNGVNRYWRGIGKVKLMFRGESLGKEGSMGYSS